MANDILLDPVTHDILLSNGSMSLCTELKELTRQRVEITLKTFLGEWFANTLFGVPYFQTIYGKNTKTAADIAIKSAIQGVEGIVELISFESSLDTSIRKLTVTFKALCTDGAIIEQEIVV